MANLRMLSVAQTIQCWKIE